MATYNPYNDAYSIYKLKNSWHEADAKGDTATKDKSAKEAQAYYQSLIKNGYSDIAEKLQKTDNKGAKDVIKNLISSVQQPTGDEWYQNNLKELQSNPEWTDGVKTGSSTGVETVKSSMPEAKDTETITGKINDLYGIQRSDRETMAGKYDTLEDYNYNHNPYESEIGKSIMEDYKFKGKTASDNAVASGGASNGGNIDSYASANANRQQMAFTNAGKQAVLADFNTRIANARGILSDLGVYQQNQDKGMQTTIGLQQTEEQRQFENEETKKNNEVDRGVKISEVTGYVPDSFVSANNPFFDNDGNLIDVKNTDYSLIIHNAEEKLKTETDPKKRADLEATIKYAKQARVVKTNMPEYSKYRNTLELYSPDETFTSKVTNKQLDNDKAIEDKKLELTEKEIEANKSKNTSSVVTIDGNEDDITQDSNGTYVDGVKVGDKNGKPILTYAQATEQNEAGNTSAQVAYALEYYGVNIDDTTTGGDSGEPEIDVQAELDEVYDSSSKTVQNYIRNVLEKDLINAEESGIAVDEAWLKNHLINYSAEYDIEVKDIKAIYKALGGTDTKWVDDYKNAGWFGWGKGVKSTVKTDTTDTSETSTSETDKTETTYSANNPYFNEKGELLDYNINYSQIITDAQNKLVITTDPTEIANLKKTIKYAQEALKRVNLKHASNAR